MTRPFSLVLLLALLAPCAVRAQTTLTVGPPGAVRTLTEALDRAVPGTDIRVQPGVYREPTLRVDTPVSITALGEVVLDGVRAGRLWILTHPESATSVLNRAQAIADGGVPTT